MDSNHVLDIDPIGTVKNGISEFTGQNWAAVVSEIVVKPELIEALDNIDDFSHIIVLFWTRRSGADNTLRKVHPKNNPELPLVGIFATRSPVRPNPVSMTVVKLLERRENILRVKGLDAFDLTPVIDVKPYIPGSDSIADAEVPGWVTERQHR